MQYGADEYALEVEDLVLSLRPMLSAANRPHNASDEVMDDLMDFILKRHANYRLGGNVSPAFLSNHSPPNAKSPATD